MLEVLDVILYGIQFCPYCIKRIGGLWKKRTNGGSATATTDNSQFNIGPSYVFLYARKRCVLAILFGHGFNPPGLG